MERQKERHLNNVIKKGQDRVTSIIQGVGRLRGKDARSRYLSGLEMAVRIRPRSEKPCQLSFLKNGAVAQW
jgi:hypothetical protein